MSKRSTRRGRGKLVLRLYQADESPNSVLALRHLRDAIAHLTSEQVALEVIDVLRDPERALSDGVLVTPTLVKASPPPESRVIGNLRDRSALLAALGIDEAGDA
jgi:circadian clock protein KaiB